MQREVKLEEPRIISVVASRLSHQQVLSSACLFHPCLGSSFVDRDKAWCWCEVFVRFSLIHFLRGRVR